MFPKGRARQKQRTIRTGSPFAGSSIAPSAVALVPAAEGGQGTDVPLDAGVFPQTALGGLVAAWLIVPWAVAGFLWFPAGGMMVVVLGIMLAMIAGFSTRPRLALGTLAIYVVLAALFLSQFLV